MKKIIFMSLMFLVVIGAAFPLELAALENVNPQKGQYMYMIEGLHEDWIYLGQKNEINFANLEPGKYIFRVKRVDSAGIWNDKGISFKIIIKPPFWQTQWFRMSCVLLLVTMLFIWYRTRKKNLSLRLKTEVEMSRIFEEYNISRREQEILQLILKGKTNKDIEDALFISIRTVKNHIYNIYQKFGVKTRLELIHLILRSMARP
jgi:DNA-binding CsgD family transcriptional regulator